MGLRYAEGAEEELMDRSANWLGQCAQGQTKRKLKRGALVPRMSAPRGVIRTA